jgi:hypothetical protein
MGGNGRFGPGLSDATAGDPSDVSELDGEWKLSRLSGALPPLRGVHKRIDGDRGSTVLPVGAGVPFAVVGRELRYRPPFSMFVDVLEPDGDGWRGRATVFGRTFGEFRMSRAQLESSTRV